MVILDTNAVLRYILQDNTAMADKVESIITREACLVPTEVVAEMVYVLSGVYQVGRMEISDVISRLFDMDNIQSKDFHVVKKALETYANSKLDFVDCLMVGYSQVDGDSVFTFDKELKKLL